MVTVQYYPNVGIIALNDIKHQCEVCGRTLVGKWRCRHRGARNKDLRRIRPQKPVDTRIAAVKAPVEAAQYPNSKSGWCPECTGEFPSRKALEAHIQMEHIVLPSDASTTQSARAQTAPVKRPRDSDAQTNDEVSFDCTMCSASFPTEYALKKHSINLPSCFACSMHLYPGQSLHEHLRTSLNHPHCHRCDLGFMDDVRLSMHQAHCRVITLDKKPGINEAFHSRGHNRRKKSKQSLVKHLAALGAFDRRPGLSYQSEPHLSGHSGIYSSNSLQTFRDIMSQEEVETDVLPVRGGPHPAAVSAGNTYNKYPIPYSPSVTANADA
ncbi:hypothetical protein C8Q80DRAFT_1179186 [Daedaleopsis nitida]|nr:hypothetical protein C8Q80DRAFT_1179186 [Daedaleopsis nitida]